MYRLPSCVVMQPDRLAVYGVFGLVVLVAAATGPHVGMLSIPPGGLGGADDAGTGFATVAVVSAPENGSLDAETYGDVHYLRVPDAAVEVSRVEGAPLLTLSLDVPALGYQRSSVYTIGERGPDTRSYGVSRSAIESDRIDKQVYDGSLRVVLQDDRGRTVVYEGPITVRVTE